MAIDLGKARRDTPGTDHVLHFNNAGSALMPQVVLDAQIEHLQLEARIGGYESAAAAREKIERVYDAAADLIGADPGEIAIIENATRAWDMAFYSIPFRSGDRILTAMAEYASNYIAYLQIAQRTGAVVEVIPNDEHGQTSVARLREMLDDRVKLISITHIPTNGGLVNPAAEIGKIANDAGVLYLVDACQSVGQLPVRVDEIGCDMLSTTGRKYLRGPRGTGFLYVRNDVVDKLEPVMLDLHAATWTAKDEYTIAPGARRFENWETNYAGKIGLGVAIDYALGWGIDSIWARIQTLADGLRSELNTIPGVTVRDLGEVRCGIVTFEVEGRDAASVRDELAKHGINVTASGPASTRLDMENRGIQGLVRASVHYYNSEDEVGRFCEVLEGIVR
ncbi:MAG TPA: aminotransferase class V-fold PLP-dependent enzyme [Thermomicrobiales bacterium]|nr:aminotransferase class V-fold PLP-dependent enzyme [Thermomicrobiales bacterium]